MTATAAVGMTPAAAVFAATSAAVGGVTGGGAPPAPAKVEVNIKGRMKSLFDIMDKRYQQKKTVQPGGKTNRQFL